jgi:hypothetical protein
MDLIKFDQFDYGKYFDSCSRFQPISYYLLSFCCLDFSNTLRADVTIPKHFYFIIYTHIYRHFALKNARVYTINLLKIYFVHSQIIVYSDRAHNIMNYLQPDLFIFIFILIYLNFVCT